MLSSVFQGLGAALSAGVWRALILRSRNFKKGVFAPVIFGLAFLAATDCDIAYAQTPSDTNRRALSAEGGFATTPEPGISGMQTRRRQLQPFLPKKVTLDRLDTARLSKEAANQPSKPGVPLKIGFSRDVPGLLTALETSAQLVWTAVSGGQVATISVTSPDALGVRLGLLVEKLPTSAVLRFFSQGSDQAFTVSGQDIMEAIARNQATGDKTDETRTYWSPVIEGQEITLEIELPAGIPLGEVMFSIPRVSHLFSSPLDTRALQQKIGQSGTCNLDSVCYASSWGNESLATAKMTFTRSGSSYLCTGTLLADQDSSTSVPYFLTANHCISTPTEASSLQTYWFYRASSCNSGSLSASNQTLTGGATLLYGNAATDTSFLRLNGVPPTGAYYSGWTANAQALNTPGTGVHNPDGDLQKISFGAISDYVSCTAVAGSNSSSCTATNVGNADHFDVVWSQGITEGGSSGSGLWVTSGSSHYLVGQLHGGSSFCTAPTSPDYYGRFDVAYNAALYQWLGASSSCSYSLTSSSQSVVAAGQSGTVSVVSTSNCAWTAISNVSWITVVTGTAGNGNGAVTYSVSANPSTTSRIGTLVIAGQVFTVSQSGTSGAGSSNLLANSDFESGTSFWMESSSGGYDIVTNNVSNASHTGSYYAWLGGYASGTDSLSQNVLIPADVQTAYIQFWYDIATSETSTSTAWDTMTVDLYSVANGSKLATLVTLSNLNATPGGWVQTAQLDVSAYKGQTVQLRFTATTDSSNSTSFFLDDLSLAITAAPICTVNATPARILPKRSSTLTASCAPVATAYRWTGGTCVGNTTSSCTVTPNVTTTYSVTGTNSYGSNTSSATVTVRPVNLSPILMLLLD